MPRKRKYTATSALRHQLKMERVLLGRPSEETALAAARAINAEWSQAYGNYREVYRKLKEYLGKAHPDVPSGLYGLYRSFLFKALANVPKGASPDAIIDEFAKKCRLDVAVMRDVLEQFGMHIERSEEELVTSK
jgi:hypothetical protein